ncbi:hypothetical protein OAK75_04300 [Bacteriovoracales bacterium]|nr:hypothetical protein [Bacteriovoracales bacterium]
MDYFEQICQLKRRLSAITIVFVLLYGAGCTTSKSVLKKITRRVKGEESSVQDMPTWSEVKNKEGKMSETGHPFFSFAPRGSLETGLIHYMATTPVGSPYRYDLHLGTGVPYRAKRYCKQKDVWEAQKSSITRPIYSEGFVPRLLDSTGRPQKIIVFGSPPNHPLDFDRFQSTRPVKVLGGFLEQYCRRYPCTKNKTWESRLVLVAVDPINKDFLGLQTFKKLKKTINWRYAKSFLENSQGRTLSFYDKVNEKGDLPAFRVIGHFEGKEALKKAFKAGYLFKEKEIILMKNSCEKLYGHLWSVAKHFKKSKNIEKTFSSFFDNFFTNYGKSYETCSRFMGSTRRVKNMGKVWFYSFMDAVFHVYKLGYVYDCSKRVWVRKSKESKVRKLFANGDSCKNGNLNDAFDAAVTTLGILKSNNDHSYFYKTYDFGPGGTHQRLYSWIYDTGKEILCVNEDEKMSVEDTRSSFPNDVRWRPL